MEFLTYRHVVNFGDLISSLPGVKHLYETIGRKAIIYQQLNRPGEYFLGAQHPTKNDRGEMVCFNQAGFDKMRPLLLAQQYIEDFRVFNGEQIDYDLDVVRHQIYCGAPHFPLHKWLWMAYPEMTCDLSDSWIRTPPVSANKNNIIVNLTQRYRNYNINYFFLKKYEGYITFAGTDEEHELFCEQWKLTVPKLQVENFLQLAEAIQSCTFFIGNQSFCWHLAQAMHAPRLLELYPHAQNCTNFGANGYEFYHQPQLEYLVDFMFSK